jgi:hypothetical protein
MSHDQDLSASVGVEAPTKMPPWTGLDNELGQDFDVFDLANVCDVGGICTDDSGQGLGENIGNHSPDGDIMIQKTAHLSYASPPVEKTEAKPGRSVDTMKEQYAPVVDISSMSDEDLGVFPTGHIARLVEQMKPDGDEDSWTAWGLTKLTFDDRKTGSLTHSSEGSMATTAGPGASVSTATQDTKGMASCDLRKCDSQCRLSRKLRKNTLTNDFCGHTSNCISGFLNSYLETLTGANSQFTREADFQSDKWSRDQL